MMDDGSFQRGAARSLDTLDKLKKSLKFDGGTGGVEKLADAVTKVDFSNIKDGVLSAETSISKMSVVGITALSNLTNTAVNFGKKLVRSVIEPLTTGGWNRAQNIEKAKFSLQGLGYTGEKLTKIWTNIDDAVTGTSYSLDSAAMVASMLASSGIKAGEGVGEMGHALKAVSGVAAQTNSSYADIGDIFSQVAGQGKLMGEQLNRLSFRGMNAAADLAKAMNKTEAEVRDMVSKGQIDFATFSEAMYKAYSENAFKANETLSGVLANTRAALAKIGQDFFTPFQTNQETFDKTSLEMAMKYGLDMVDIHGNTQTKITELYDKNGKKLTSLVDQNGKDIIEVYDKNGKKLTPHVTNLVEMFQQIRTTINNFRDSLKPLWEAIQVPAMKVIQFITRGLSALNGIFDKVKAGVAPVTKAAEAVKETTKAVDDLAKAVINGDWGNGEARFKALAEAGHNWAEVQNKVNEMLGCSYRYEVENAKAIDKNTEASKKNTEVVKEKTRVLRDFRTTVVEGLTNGIEALIKPVNAIFAAFGNVFKLEDFVYVLNLLGDAFERITRKLIITDGSASSLYRIFHTLFSTIKSVLEALGPVFDLAVDGLEAFMGVVQFGIEKLLEFVAVLANLASGPIKLFANAIKTSVGFIRDEFELIAKGVATNPKFVQALTTWKEAVDNFKQAWTNLKNALVDGAATILQALGGPFAKIGEKLKKFKTTSENTLIDFISSSAKRLADWSKSLSDIILKWSETSGKTIHEWSVSAGKYLAEFAKDPVGHITRGCQTIIGAIKGWIDGTDPTISNWVSSTGAKLAEWSSGPITKIKDACKTAKDSIMDWLDESHPKVAEFLRDTADKLEAFYEKTAPKVKEWCEEHIEAFSKWFNETKPLIEKWCQDAVTAITNWCQTAGPAIVDWVVTTLTAIKDYCIQIGSDIIDWFRTNPLGDAISNWLSGISLSSMGEFFNSPIGFIKKSVGKIDLAGPLKAIFDKADKQLDKSGSTSGKAAVNALRATFLPLEEAAASNGASANLAMGKAVNATYDPLAKAVNEENAAKIRESFKTGITEMFSGITDSCSNFISKFGEIVANFDAGEFLDNCKTIAEAAFILSATKTTWQMGNMLKDFGTGFKTACDGIKGAADGFKEMMNSIANIPKTIKDITDIANKETTSKKLIAFSVLVGTLAAAIAYLGKQPFDEVRNGVGAIAVGMFAITWSIKSMEKGIAKISNGQMQGVSKDLYALAVVIGVMAGAVAILGHMELSQIGVGLAGIGGAMGLLAVGIIALEFGLKKLNTASKGEGLLQGKNTATNLIALAGSMFILAIAVKMLGSMDMGELGRGIGAVAVMLIAMGAALFMIGSAKNSLKGASGTIFALATSMLILAAAVKLFGNMNLQELKQGLGACALGLLMLGAATAGIKAVSGSLKGTAGTIFALATSLLVLWAAVKLFSMMDFDTFYHGGVRAALALFAISVAAGALKAISGDLKGVAKTLIALSTSLLILWAAIKLFSTMDWGSFASGGSMAAIGLVALGAAVWALSKVTEQSGNLSKTLISVAIALGVLAGAIFLMSNLIGEGKGAELALATVAIAVGLVALGVALKLMDGTSVSIGGILAMAVALGVLTGCLYVLSSIPLKDLASGLGILALALILFVGVGALAGYFPVIAAGMNAVGAACLMFGAGCLMVSAAIWLLVDALQKCADIAPESVSRIADTLVAASQEFAEHGYELGKNFMVGVLKGLTGAVAGVVQACGEGLSGLWDGICKLIKSDGQPKIAKTSEDSLVNGTGEGTANAKQKIQNDSKQIPEAQAEGVKDTEGQVKENIEGNFDGAEEVNKEEARKAAAASGDGTVEGYQEAADTAEPAVRESADQVSTRFADRMVETLKSQMGENFTPEMEEMLRANMGEMDFSGVADGISMNFGDALGNIDVTSMLGGLVGKLTGGEATQMFGDAAQGNIEGYATSLSTAEVPTESLSAVNVKVAETLKTTAEEPLKGAGDQALMSYTTGLGGGLSGGIQAKIAPVANTVTTTLVSELKNRQATEVLGAGQDAGNRYCEGLSTSITNDTATPTAITGITTSLASHEAEFQQAGQFSGEAYAKSAATGIETLDTASIIGAVVTSLTSGDALFRFSEAGRQAVTEYINGLVTAPVSSAEVMGVNSAVSAALVASASELLPQAGSQAMLSYTTGLNTDAPAKIQPVAQTMTATLVSALQNGNSSVLEAGRQSGLSYCQGLSAAISSDGTVSSAVTTLISTINAKSSEYTTAGTTSSAAYIKALQSGITTGMSSVSTAATTTITNLLNAVVQIIRNSQSQFTESGRYSLTGFVNGMVSMQSTSEGQARNISMSSGNAMMQSSGFYSAGLACMQGFINGMVSMEGSVYNTAYNLGIKALNAAKAAVDSNSPSKEFMKLGVFCGDGMSIGLRNSTGDVVDNARDMGMRVLEAMDSVLDGMSVTDDFGLDSQPVITPILDLSQVYRDMNDLDGIFGGNYGLSASASQNITGSVNSILRKIEADEAASRGSSSSTVTNGDTTFNCTFNVSGSSNPRETAEEISRELQRLVERRDAAWGR